MRYLLIILILASCNPVKRVMKDPKKFDVVAKEVLRRGYCVNDTVVIEKVKDSIVYLDTPSITIQTVDCKDIDTTIGRSRIQLRSGVLTVKCTDSIVYRTKVITNNIRDKSKEAVLLSDIKDRDDEIKSLKDQIKTLNIEKRELKVGGSTWRNRFILLLAGTVVLLAGSKILKLYLSRL